MILELGIKLRVPFDIGSHKTFVTSKVVRELGVGPKRVDSLGTETFGPNVVDEKKRIG